MNIYLMCLIYQHDSCNTQHNLVVCPCDPCGPLGIRLSVPSWSHERALCHMLLVQERTKIQNLKYNLNEIPITFAAL